ncbi:MAG: class I SAM-dependent methyltransferase [Actinomycetota bacterium]|nr:class I SAM-dependent methyltransferase [Actinomycetota bacterium]
MRSAVKVALGAVGIIGGVAYWWRKNPSACPYSQRLFLEAPHPVITRGRLMEILVPKPGERVLEVGPGTGYYTLDVAGALGASGRLDIFDLQQEMLDHTLRRARQRGIENIVPAQGDAQTLSYPDDTFDAAYLTATLGEIPDKRQALRELQRVLKPAGRLVVGEVFGDPHMVKLNHLQSEAGSVGLRFDHQVGGRLGYFARFTA